MIYKFKCEVCLGYGCGGWFNGDNAEIKVELTDEEAQQIRENIDPDSEDVIGDIEDKLPEIYDKIMEEVYPYVYFVVANDARESGLWQDCIRSGRDIEDFIQEDIDNGAVDDEDDEGNPLSEDEIYRQWREYEEEHIRSLSYHDAYEYIIARYECEPDSIEGVTYSIELPEELQEGEEEEE